jgi:long-chain fatty acid transport protein
MHRERLLRWMSFFAPVSFLAVLCVAAGAEAQPLTIPRFDFSFSNPGARSLGFGGAFAALADDATAAYANPAGLVQLAAPEVSFETRFWSRSPAFLAGGRLDGEPTGIGIDTRRGLAFGRDQSQDFGPSFASVVVPRGRWSFALYGHQLAQFEQSAASQGFFSDEDLFFPFGLFRSPALRETAELEVVTAGTAAGWRMNDRLSFGLGIVISDVSLTTKSDSYFPSDGPGSSPYGVVSFLPEARLFTTTLSIDGTAVTVNAGVLGRVSEQLSASLFYRQGAKVEGTADFTFGPAFPVVDPFRNRAELKVPDVAGAGLAFRSKDGRVTLATEVDHVGYSGLIGVEDSSGLDYRDAWEYHVGAEYALLRFTPILALRAGAWIESTGDNLSGDDEVTHLSAGIGIAASTFQIDVGGDLAETGDTASISIIYTF